MNQNSENLENDDWPPPIERPPVHTAHTKNPLYIFRSGLFLGLLLNGIAVSVNIPFLRAAKGSAIDTDATLPAVAAILFLSIFVGLPLAISHIVVSINKHRPAIFVIMGLLAVLLNLTPLWFGSIVYHYAIHTRSLHYCDDNDC